MSASDALAAVRTLYDVANKVKHTSLVTVTSYLFSQVSTKVKDNKSELLRLSRRIEHVVVTLHESRSRDIIRSDEYNDALSAIFEYGSRSFKMFFFKFDDVLDSFITRTQRLAQRLLKRNLGDRTWNNGEITSELRRLNDDVQSYLSVHTVSNMIFSS
jgi:hypothetical protein